MRKAWSGAGAVFHAVLLGAVAPTCMLAQGAGVHEKTVAFDVVSIRPEPSSRGGHEEIAVTPNGWHMAHGPLIAALLTAYVPTTNDAMMYTVRTLSGVPEWMRTELYNIDVRVGEADIAAWQNPATQPAMLHAMMQSMLAERCKLAVHRESKEVAVYSLVVGKKGSKLKVAVAGEEHAGAVRLPGGGEFMPNDGNGVASFYGAPVAALAVILSNIAGRPVEDRTGLAGRYDMSFRRPRPGGPAMEADSGANPPPTIFEVAESLGLKLEPSKTAVEILTVDHAERPSSN